MDTKLTLSLDKNIIQRAKIYAKSNRMSLSKMIESYLASLTNSVDIEEEVVTTPLVESLTGIVDLPVDFDYKKEYGDYLLEKYK